MSGDRLFEDFAAMCFGFYIISYYYLIPLRLVRSEKRALFPSFICQCAKSAAGGLCGS